MAGSDVVPCIELAVHRGQKLGIYNIVGIEDDTCIIPVSPFRQAAVERPRQRMTFRLMLQVIAFKHSSAHCACYVCRVVSAVVGDDEHIEEVGGIVLLLQAANEVAYHPLLIPCADEHRKAVIRAGAASEWRRAAEHMESGERHVGPVER